MGLHGAFGKETDFLISGVDLNPKMIPVIVIARGPVGPLPISMAHRLLLRGEKNDPSDLVAFDCKLQPSFFKAAKGLDYANNHERLASQIAATA